MTVKIAPARLRITRQSRRRARGRVGGWGWFRGLHRHPRHRSVKRLCIMTCFPEFIGRRCWWCAFYR